MRWAGVAGPRRAAWAGLALVPLLAACGVAADAAGVVTGAPAAELRLGHFATATHAPAIIGVADDVLVGELGPTTLSAQVFDAGPAVVEALFAGALDAAYLGPNPAINGFVASDGEALRIVAGATSGGAQLVVRPDIDTPAQLAGTTLATPQLGSTQDVALRAWLADQGLATTLAGGGDVTVLPTAHADALALFQAGELDGAWAPEPWASMMVLEAGGSVLVDERDLWPASEFATAQLVVRTAYLTEHPATVEALLRGHVEVVAHLADAPGAAAEVNAGLAELTGEPLDAAVMARALDHLAFTVDPLAATLSTVAAHAATAGTLDDAVDLHGIYSLDALNALLRERGLPAVDDAGLGIEATP